MTATLKIAFTLELIAFTLELEDTEGILPLLDDIVRTLDAIQHGPTPDDLARAPVLENWCPLIDVLGVPVLCGDVTEQDELKGGMALITARLLGVDVDRTWARTEEVWYRLGEPLSHARAEAIPVLAEDSKASSATAFVHPDHTKISNGPFLDQLLRDSGLRIREIRDGLANALEQFRAAEAADTGDGVTDGHEEQNTDKQEETQGGKDGTQSAAAGDGQPK